MSCHPSASGLGTLGPRSGLVLKEGLSRGRLEEGGPWAQREEVSGMRGARGPKRKKWQGR
jgi:hypothetical protein